MGGNGRFGFSALGTLRILLGAVNVFFGAQRAFDFPFEHQKFVELLLLDEPFLRIFGFAQIIVGLLMLLNVEVSGSLFVGTLLHFTIALAAWSSTLHPAETIEELADSTIPLHEAQSRVWRMANGWVALHIATFAGYFFRTRKAKAQPS